MQTESDRSDGAAADADKRKRPGVPQKRSPKPAGQAHWTDPERQPVRVGVLKDEQRPEFTATFGTGQKPKGLSGAMRRVAYGIPDYEVKRWALLLVADRVDTMEWELGRAVKSPLAWTVLIGGSAALAIGIWQLRPRRRPPGRNGLLRAVGL
jgi:hypothetical protein